MLTAAAWLQSPPPLTADDARDVAREAFEEAGFAEVEVGRPARRSPPRSDGEAIDAWRTRVDLSVGRVHLWLARDDGAAVYLDDRSPDGSERLLTSAQVDALDDHAGGDATRDRQITRNLVATVAAGLIALLAVRVAVAVAHTPTLERPTSPPRTRPLRAERIDP